MAKPQVAAKKLPKVDAKACIGCGVCVSLCPKVFEMKELGGSHKSVVRKDADTSSCNLIDAKDSCPVGAISV